MIYVVNKHSGISGEYIGRGSPLGNPFPIGKDTREEVIIKYREYIYSAIVGSSPAILTELTRLANIAKMGDLYLVCFCAPKACHGDIVKEIIEEILRA